MAAPFLNFSLWPLGWVSFAPLVIAFTTSRSRRESIALGLVTGLSINVPAFAWLVHTIHVFGGFPRWLSAFFYGALSTYSSLELVLFALAVRRLGFGPLALWPALCWVALEFFFPNLFPWRIANGQLEVPALMQIGELTGPFGLSLVMVWMARAIAQALVTGFGVARRSLAFSAGASVAVALYGVVRLPAIDQAVLAAPVVRLGIVQGNLTIEEKLDARYLEGNLDTYRRLSLGLSPPSDVVIWPESVITEPLPRTLRSLSPEGRDLLGLTRPLFAGALTYEGDPQAPRFFNSVLLFDADGRVLGMSDKQILMPFGEYMPLGSVFPWLKRLSPQTGDFQAASEVVPLEVPGVGRFAPLNCYEDLRAPIARHATRHGRAEILFAVANDGWFGDTVAPYQHEALAIWRAIENRRFLVRVTNTGVTDVVDPAGRVLLRLPVFQPAATVAEVRRLGMITPYTRFGDWFAWTVTAVVVSGLAAGSRARSGPPSRPRSPD
jgi:apolipoprotein N-acyltransferase